MKKAHDSQKFHTGTILLISFSHLIHDVFGAFLAPLLPLLVQKLGFSYTLTGFLTVAQRFPSLLNPVLGAFADRIRLKYFLIFSPAVTAICMSLLGVAPSYAVLVILLMIMGVSSACYHVPTPVIIRHIAANRVGKGMSFYMFGGELARTLGPLLVVGAVGLWGLEGTYKLIPLGVIPSIFLYIKLKDVDVQKGFCSTAQATGRFQTFKNLFSVFAGLTGITLFMGAMKMAMTSFLPLYLTEKGYSVSIAGVSVAILQAGGVVGVLAAGYLSDRFGRKIIIFVVTIAAPLLMWIFLMNPGIFTLPILCILGFFLFSTGPVMLAIVQETNSEHPAYVNGIYMMTNFISNSLMSVATGALSDWIGFENMYRISTMWFLGIIPCLWLLPGEVHIPSFLSLKQLKEMKKK